MASFVEERLPEQVEKGATGGPSFNTTVFELSSGYEKRNENWSVSRGSWDIGYGIQTKEDFTEVLAFFYARHGRSIGFRYKDWTDYEIGDDANDEDQSIGTGDNAKQQFQVIRTYPSTAGNYDRIIKKLVNGTVRVFLDNVEQFSGFTIDNDTGIITFAIAPGVSVDVGVICEFDVPVRFDTDKINISAETFDAGAIPNLPIVELRLRDA